MLFMALLISSLKNSDLLLIIVIATNKKYQLDRVDKQFLFGINVVIALFCDATLKINV